MSLLTNSERKVLEAMARVADANPFLPERVAAERSALGTEFKGDGMVWHAEGDRDDPNRNLRQLAELAERHATPLRERLAAGGAATAHELLLYQRLVLYLLYQRYEPGLYDLIAKGTVGEPTTKPLTLWKRFAFDAGFFFDLPSRQFPEPTDPAVLFALAFQVRRAFHHTFRQIYGGSLPAALLRAAVWQSIFTHDASRYRRELTLRMSDVPTLIAGESGTGKELVARAIAFSRFIPFDSARGAFQAEWWRCFHGLNLSALSPTLVESELFGHRRGSFTGALEDRAGWFEGCGPSGVVFLDEIGELDPIIQVKLLRVLQTRTFQRIGETDERPFAGKIVAATNRDLAAEMKGGAFRADLYYRLCADMVRAPSLREQLAGSREELHNLTLVLSQRIIGADEAPRLSAEVVDFVVRRLGLDYAWPGNVRELEQCVRSVLVRGEYTPPQVQHTDDEDLAAALRAGELTADALLRRYATAVFRRFGSYEETARRLGIDRRTVKAKVGPAAPARRRGG